VDALIGRLAHAVGERKRVAGVMAAEAAAEMEAMSKAHVESQAADAAKVCYLNPYPNRLYSLLSVSVSIILSLYNLCVCCCNIIIIIIIPNTRR
jgi:hypothetical protein